MNCDCEKITIGERASKILRAILGALENEDIEVRNRIMIACGKECANLPCPPMWEASLDIVRDIVSKTNDLKKRIELLNQLVPWCADWVVKNDWITSECTTCGCLLVQNGAVDANPIWCQCSVGWVKSIFEVVFQSPVQVKLASAIGQGDKTCKYMVKPNPTYNNARSKENSLGTKD